MSAFEWWTYLSIGILLVFAPAVFAWFLREAVDLLRGIGTEEAADERRGSPGRTRDSRQGQV